MKRFVFIVFLLLSQLLSAQNNPDIKRTMNWYFGWGVGIDFTSGSPVANTDNNAYYTGNFFNDQGKFPIESVWSESDTCGNLLFFSNDRVIFDADGDTLLALDPLLWHPTQRLAVPEPGNDSIYYFFYYHWLSDNNYYGILNVKKKQNPVISWNVIQFTGGSEMVAGYQHCNGQDMWIINKKNQSTCLYAWLLTPAGLSSSPVVSSVIDLDTLTESENAGSLMRISPDGQYAAIVIRKYPDQMVNTYINIFRFNNCTGRFDDRIVIPFWGAYGLCFSPDGTKLYTAGYIESEEYPGYSPLVQFDLDDYSQTAIQNSMVAIHGDSHIDYHDGMQLGVDGKIYVADWDVTNEANPSDSLGLTHLGIIQNPNAEGLLCNYTPNSFYLQGRLHYAGFPQYPDSYFRSFDYYDCYPQPEPDDSVNYQVFVPNIFSPNGDGINDVLYVRSEYAESIRFFLYDRWGNLVFTGTHIHQGWDGYYNGKQAGVGVYFYYLTVNFDNGQERAFSGNVTLVR